MHNDLTRGKGSWRGEYSSQDNCTTCLMPYHSLVFSPSLPGLYQGVQSIISLNWSQFVVC